MSSKEVVIYTTMFCPYCQSAKALLTRKGVAFQEKKVDGDRAARRAVGGLPQIFVDGQHIGGCDDLYALEKAGKLDHLLTAAAG